MKAAALSRTDRKANGQIMGDYDHGERTQAAQRPCREGDFALESWSMSRSSKPDSDVRTISDRAIAAEFWEDMMSICN